MMKAYLDYASSTPTDPDVKTAMMPYFSEIFGNAGAMHGLGQMAQAAVFDARQKIADFFDCDFKEIIFTGSATESNNLAIRGVIKNVRGSTPHIVTSSIEHKSVVETCRDLEKDGVEVTYLPVTKDGFVRPDEVKAAIKENTVLVSIMYVNNEIGTIQPIREIAQALKGSKAVFHTDAVQALNYLECNVGELGVDLLSFSGHKIYGPKGIGGLYIKKGTEVAPLITGGNQEFGLRSGTENVPYIVGLGKAIELITERREGEAERLRELRDYFIEEVLKNIGIAQLNGFYPDPAEGRENRIANNANFIFKGVPANNLLIALDQEGVAASSGSTCTIKTVTPSHTLIAIGRSEEEASQGIRFTLGSKTTKEEIDYTVSVLEKVIKRTQ